MDQFTITVVGNNALGPMTKIFGNLGLTAVNSPDVSKLGNLRTYTFKFPMSEDKVVSARVIICKRAKDAGMVPMYVFGDATRVIVFDTI